MYLVCVVLCGGLSPPPYIAFLGVDTWLHSRGATIPIRNKRREVMRESRRKWADWAQWGSADPRVWLTPCYARLGPSSVDALLVGSLCRFLDARLKIGPLILVHA